MLVEAHALTKETRVKKNRRAMKARRLENRKSLAEF